MTARLVPRLVPVVRKKPYRVDLDNFLAQLEEIFIILCKIGINFLMTLKSLKPFLYRLSFLGMFQFTAFFHLLTTKSLCNLRLKNLKHKSINAQTSKSFFV